MATMIGMTAEQAAEAGKSLTFEKVWAAMDRYSEELRTMMKENETIDGFNYYIGPLAEMLIAGQFWEKFELYDLKKIFREVPIYSDDENKRSVVLTNIDILLSNNDCAIVVDVKCGLKIKDCVDKNIKRMKLVRRYPPAEIAINNKRVMGAMASGPASPVVTDYAHECGFFVIELKWGTARLVEAPAGFKPREW